MSHNIRPEIRTWGPCAGVTCSTDEAALLFLTLSRIDNETPVTVSDDGDYTRFHWAEADAIPFLEKLERLVLESDSDRIIRLATTDAGEVTEEEMTDMRFFLANLKFRVREWKACVEDDPEHGLDLLMD